MWRRILAYLLFALGFLTFTFFRRYSGEVIPYPFLFYILGLIMFVGGLLFLRYTPRTTDLQIQARIAQTIEELKTTGEKIPVDLSRCEIKEHNYTEEQELYGHPNELLTLDFERQIQGFNALGGGSHRNVVQVEVRQTVIIYDYQNPRSGKLEKFISRVIPKDKITLSFYVDRQKYTDLYVDKINREKYYFDLDFLFKED
jgi:hypothetical protein